MVGVHKCLRMLRYIKLSPVGVGRKDAQEDTPLSGYVDFCRGRDPYPSKLDNNNPLLNNPVTVT